MSKLEGLVAEVLDQFRIVANIGKNDNVEQGMKFLIYSEEGGYIDPETGEDLGSRRVEKAQVEVVEVYEKMSVMESSKEVYQSPFPSSLVTGTKSKKKLPTKSTVESNEMVVERGDNLIQIFDDSDGDENSPQEDG